MLNKNQTVFHWSSGKDSALALYYLLSDNAYAVNRLVTSINDHYDRVTMRGTPLTLLKKQVKEIGIELNTINLPRSPSMEDYEQYMRDAMHSLKSSGFTHAAFGDIFLEDLKNYREKEMAKFGLDTVFPIWEKDTKSLLEEFIALGFKAVIVSANARLGEEFLGRTIDNDFIKDLPSDIDPCGENGEFHTFCYDGPIFNKAVKFRLGEKIKRSYPNPTGDGTVDFWFIDLLS
ncbi:Dph6-related ATP pyrophosphatase [Ekhidna sp.]